ncbi:unnamed protein product [Trichobilharzia regenti]|nr:unnamed protein product [Trichobilharzia regenti]
MSGKSQHFLVSRLLEENISSVKNHNLSQDNDDVDDNDDNLNNNTNEFNYGYSNQLNIEVSDSNSKLSCFVFYISGIFIKPF